MASKYCVTMTLPNGQRKYYYGSTKKEAIKKRDADKLLVGKGVDVQDTTTFRQMAEAWYTLYKKDRVALNTERAIQYNLSQYIYPKLGDRLVKDVKPMHVQAVMASVSHLSRSTNSHVLQLMRSVFLMAEENGLIVKSPVVSSIKAGGPAPKEEVPLSKAQCEALLEALEGTAAYLMVRLILASGLRIGEAIGLMWQDIDFNRGTLTVNRSVIFPHGHCEGIINPDCKTVNAHRTIALPWDFVDLLRAEKQKSKSLYVLSTKTGGHWTEGSLNGARATIANHTKGKAKSDGKQRFERTLDFKVHPHQLRHTCITNWFAMGLDIKEVQRMAGHSDPQLTLKIYTHYLEADRFAETAQKIQGIRPESTTSEQQYCC